MLIQDFSVLKASILRYREQARSMAIRKNVNLIVCEDEKAVYADVLTEVIPDEKSVAEILSMLEKR